MATREENLKKINDELEKLSDDELEQVAGGFKGYPYYPYIRNQAQNTDPDSNQLNILNRPVDKL
ncbi:MAG: hypothetical protein IJK81_05720 [Selenomonadaceae bacterium]|nr:hypothetical protein [Selenomonadaceae bacterium]